VGDENIGNMSNVKRGKEFQLRAQSALEKLTGIQFKLEVKLPIGRPPKLHPFDLASPDQRIIGESKAYTWTISGKTPSAKITNLKEAAQYLNDLPAGTNTFIIMKREVHPIKGESLAEYFSRLNKHLLGAVAVLELADDDTVNLVHGHFNFSAGGLKG